MNINCKRFRVSTYREHKVTGSAPVRECRFITYRSADHGGKQMNYSLKLGLTTWHFKWRTALKEPRHD